MYGFDVDQPVVGSNLDVPASCSSNVESFGCFEAADLLAWVPYLDIMGISVLMVVDRLGSRWGDMLELFGSCRGAEFSKTLFQITCLARHAEFSARS